MTYYDEDIFDDDNDTFDDDDDDDDEIMWNELKESIKKMIKIKEWYL